MNYNISDKTFQKIYEFLRTILGIHVKNEHKTRIFLEAVFYLCRTGCQVRMLPKECGNCFAIYQKFSRWKKKGIWQALFFHFQDIDSKWFIIDGSIIRVNQCAAGYKKDSNENPGTQLWWIFD